MCAYMFRLYKYPSAAAASVRVFTLKSASDGNIIKSLAVRCLPIYTERALLYVYTFP